MISLKKRLMLTYALFVSLALLVLTIISNRFAGAMFEHLIKDTIKVRSLEIVQAVTSQYNPYTRGFDSMTLEAIGMYFVHEGYIISIESLSGDMIWNARLMDMQHCIEVLDEITQRMEQYHLIKGSVQYTSYPIAYNEKPVGMLNIETYGPFFYSEGESRFLSSLNRLLLIAGLAFTGSSIVISSILASAIARPILKASEAAHRIAKGNRTIRISDTYQTKELHELAQSINTLALELGESERRQKQLTADIAHELRTPLTCLQGNVEAMIDGVWEPTPERLVSCHEEIIRLTKLVQDLSLLTTLEWEHLVLNKTRFDLAKLLQLVGDQFLNAIHSKGLELSLHLACSPVTADYDRLKQVFINLLSNAITYTDTGTITVTVAPVTRGTAVTITDTGIGISREDLPHIFDRFYRSDKSRNRATGGAGIGLTIASAIVTAHNGAVNAESETGTGSSFQVILPS